MARPPLLALLAVALAAGADAADDPVAAAVGTFLAAEDPAARERAAADLLAGAPDVARVGALLAQGRPAPKDAPTGWQRQVHRGADGVERPWLLFVPEGYDPAQRWPVLFDLHGGVSRPALLTHEELEGFMQPMWGPEAAARGWILAIPTGRAGSEWWTETGAGTVLGILADLKRRYAVDLQRVVATGFSDGGSGSYYLALAHPTPFAGFVPLNGHVGVAGVGGLEVHLRGLQNKPIYAVNTDQDGLYPSAALAPVAKAIADLGAPYVWREVKGYGHDPSYLPAEMGAIRAWLEGVRRTPHPERVVWEGTGGERGARVHWLVGARVEDRGEAAVFPDVNPLLPPGRVRLGLVLDPAFDGPGVSVKEVSEGSPAASLGLRAGDVLTGLDDTELAGPRELRTALAKKAHGDAFRLRWRRGEEVHAKEGTFPPATPQPAFSREGVAGVVDARRRGNEFDVATANVAGFDLLLPLGAVDLAQPVVVRVNGVQVHRGVVAPDLATLLAWAAKDDDPTMLYAARLPVVVPARTPAPVAPK